MDKLDHRQLAIIKRAAEDAIHACNRHYGPFLDVVAHPLNIIALIEMAQSRQAEVEQLKCENKKIHGREIKKFEENLILKAEIEEKNKRIEELESALTQIKLWESHPKNYETNFGSWGLRDFYRDLAEKALRGEHE